MIEKTVNNIINEHNFKDILENCIKQNFNLPFFLNLRQVSNKGKRNDMKDEAPDNINIPEHDEKENI